jgi:hypothetical protein
MSLLFLDKKKKKIVSDKWMHIQFSIRKWKLDMENKTEIWHEKCFFTT